MVGNFVKKVLLYDKPLRHEFFKRAFDKIGIDRPQTDDFERPHYEYCISKAAQHADRLDYSEISILEMGVGGGQGMIAAENYIKDIENSVNVDIELYGFDTGGGMPEPESAKDCPYLWFEGDFEMDVDKLESTLDFGELVLGDVEQTCPEFFETHDPAPVACVLFDLDTYTSTKHALSLFETESQNYLPRMPCYLDNIIGRFEFPMNEFVGELAAIKEFNENNEQKKIGKINGFHWRTTNPSRWRDQLFVFQDFKHPKYDEPIRERQPHKTKI